MPRLLIRADGGGEIGLGHVMRCRTLALAMRELGWETTLLTASDPGNIWSDMSGAVMPWLQAEGGTGQGFKTAMAAKMHRTDLLIVDHYGFATEDFTALWAAGPRLAVIDDLADRILPVDAVINPNPGVTPDPYAKRGVPLCLCGEAYTLVRPEIRAFAGTPVPTDGHILVTLGGGDVQCQLYDILNAMSKDEGDVPVVAAVGPACPVDRLNEWERGGARRRIVRDVNALPGLIAGASVAVTGGGTTLWETCCIGRPSVAVVWVENQRRTLDVVARYRTGEVVDARSGLSVQSIVDAVRRIKGKTGEAEDMIARQRAMIDGGGVGRVAAALTAMMKTD
ncbi:hypothetical protein KBA41_06265 [Candidatus Ozemobacteraceae bacterium]|nr:hypothetical protein [Candidatus Ozemobacteraceae bacterium]